MTKLNAALPKGESDGLSSIERALIERPHGYHVVIAVIDCKSVTTDNDTGEVEATARIRRIEPIKGDDASVAERIMRRAKDVRLGRPLLPLDLEVTVNGRQVDPATGELLPERG